jgi:hypothetical protein
MNILSLHTEQTAVGAYRTLIPARYLGARGHTVFVYDPLPKDFNNLGLYHKDFEQADLIVCGRTVSIPITTSLVLMRKQDHFMAVPGYNQSSRWFHPSGRSSTYGKIQLLTSDAATTTTEHMKRIYEPLARSVTVLPNCADPPMWEGHVVDPERVNDSSIRIVFAGGASHYGDLLECKDALMQIVAEYPNVRLFFMGCFPDWAVDWCENTTNASANRAFMVQWGNFKMWPQLLKWGGFDIALAPLTNNEFNLCKSNLKYLDYGMAGIPAVYSKIDTYSDVIHGETGMVAGNTEEWHSALKLLIEREPLRRHINVEAAAWQPQGDANERAAGLPSMQQRGV